MIKTWYIVAAQNPYIDTDAQAFLTAANITNANQINALNTLVIGLKNFNLWNKMQVIYPFLGGNASSHRFNLKNPLDTNAAYRLIFNGGWNHTLNGAQPNGVNGWANTFFMPSLVQNVNSNGLGMYITQNTTTVADPVQIGSFISVTSSTAIIVTSTILNGRLNGATNTNTSIIGGAGSFDIHKTASTITKAYKNGSLQNTWNSGGTLPNQVLYLGALNLNGSVYNLSYVNSEFRFAYMSEGLNDTEVSNLRTLVQAYQTTLGRQI